MTAYRFRLEPVLRIRRIQEEQARAALARARLREAEATREVTRRRDRLRRALDAGLPSGPSQDWQQRHDQRERLGAAVVAARAAELWACEESRSCLADWEEAAMRLGSVERIEEHHHERWMAEAVAAEQKDLDEQAVMRHVREGLRRSDAGGPGGGGS